MDQVQGGRGGFAARGGFNPRGRGRGGMGGGFGYGGGMGMGMGGGMGDFYDDGSGYGMDAYGGQGGYGMDAYGGYGMGGGMGMGAGMAMGGGGMGSMGAGMSMVPMMLPNGQVRWLWTRPSLMHHGALHLHLATHDLSLSLRCHHWWWTRGAIVMQFWAERAMGY